MKGWFDAFRNDGGPTLYSYTNRTPVTGDINTISILLVFSTLLIAFLVIFPGIRKERFTTLLSVILSLYTGSVILACNHGSSWHVGTSEIIGSYSAYSADKVHARLGAYIGLTHVNVTLKAFPNRNHTAEDIDFNERFQWIGSQEMGDSYKQSLRRGLPFPILTVAEYLSQCQEGFNWGAHYRTAGYYTGFTLWAAFASWLMMNLLLIVVPRYGAYTMAGTGTIMLLSVFLYWYLLPPHPLIIRLEDSILYFSFGSSFYLVLYSGGICLAVGLVIAAVDNVFPHKFSTVIEVDYDTPYDRHIIIEDSHVTRSKKKQAKLEEPPVTSLGSKLLRRLSSKREHLNGVDNDAFELEPPKSPWRYPFRQTAFPALNGHSNGVGMNGGVEIIDVGTETAPVRGHVQLSRPPQRTPKYPFNRQISTDSHDSVATDRSSSSLGLSFLTRIRESQRIPQSPLVSSPQLPGLHEIPVRQATTSKNKPDAW